MAKTPEPGPNVVATQATLARLWVDPASDVLAALALTLAGVLDRGEAKSQVAAVSRELRACLADLVLVQETAGPDEVDVFLAGLSTPPSAT
jgi:hypothetical protein